MWRQPTSTAVGVTLVALVLYDSTYNFLTCAFSPNQINQYGSNKLIFSSISVSKVGECTKPGLSSAARKGSTTEICSSKEKSKPYGPCPEPGDDTDELDRREAAFAMLGAVWAMGGIVPSVALNSVFSVQPANAIYGQDAKMTLPNVAEGISNRINKQCLVESLGNRECLLYLDPDNKLYQGADSELLLARLEKASAALGTIPNLVEKKKWSQVIGVLTGPMGTIVGTMDQLSKLSDKPDKAKEVSKTVKSDVINIGAAAERKQGDKALECCQMATEHLVQFVSCL